MAGGVEFGGELAIAKLIAHDALVRSVLGLAVGLATMAAGEYVAARIRPGAAAGLAAIVMIAVAILMVIRSDSAPLWYQIAFLIGGPLVSLAGGTLFARRQT